MGNNLLVRENGVLHPVPAEVILTFQNHLSHKSQIAKGSVVQPCLSSPVSMALQFIHPILLFASWLVLGDLPRPYVRHCLSFSDEKPEGKEEIPIQQFTL